MGNKNLFDTCINNDFDGLKKALKNGADIEAKDDMGETLLMVASREGNIEMVQLLLDNGADVNKKDLYGNRSLRYALGFNEESIDIIKLLLKNGANINEMDSEGDTPLIYICKNIFDEENIELIKSLLEYGADVNKKDLKGNSSLIYACENCCFRQEDIDIVKLLLKNGANINEIDSNGNTALMYACIKNKSELIKILLDNGVDVNIQNSEGLTALMYACIKNKTELVKLLIDNGANINLRCFNGFNASSYSEYNKKIKKLLYKKGIDNTVSKLSKKMIGLKWLSLFRLPKLCKSSYDEESEYLNQQIKNDVEQLIYLIKENYPFESVELAVTKGKVIWCTNKDGNRVPMIVSKLKWCINTTDKDGNTALMIASKMNKLDIVNMLLKYNADVTIKNKNNEEAWELASNQEIIQILLDSEEEIVFKHQPQNLVKLLTNFTIDTPIKYSTHLWDFGDVTKEYESFQGFIKAIKEQWVGIEYELKELSPNLYDKIYNFLLNESNKHSWCSRADISIGWSSLEGLELWCNRGNNPFDFQLVQNYEVDGKTITTFGEIINLFKREIEIRNENNMLENIFLEHQKKLGRKFSVELIKLKGRTFYIDVEKLQDTIGRIFEEIKKRDAYEIQVEVVEPNSESIELKITQLNSSSNRSAKEMIKEVDDGDFKIIKENLTNLCDWSIETNYEQGSYRVNYLRMSNIHEIEKTSNRVDGFTHILRFYKK